GQQIKPPPPTERSLSKRGRLAAADVASTHRGTKVRCHFVLRKCQIHDWVAYSPAIRHRNKFG
ncbi:hypothetical protein J6590_098180, partial [Homalodisca vitripennis]